jgi:hypothetical protein
MRVTIEEDGIQGSLSPERGAATGPGAGATGRAAAGDAVDAGPPPQELLQEIAEAGGAEAAPSADDGGPAPPE